MLASELISITMESFEDLTNACLIAGGAIAVLSLSSLARFTPSYSNSPGPSRITGICSVILV